MSKSKLDVLGYFEPFSADDVNSLKLLVFWLESTKIRFFPPENRDVLDVQKDNESWNVSFQTYLKDLGIEASGSMSVMVDELLNLALELQMDDVQKEMSVTDAEISILGTKNSFNISHVDINSPAFLENLCELSRLLHVPFNRQEPLITLRAIAILLRQLKFKSQVSSSIAMKSNELSNEIENQILDRNFFHNKKPAAPELNRAFNLLRLLYVSDLRDLQNTINSIIVQIQTFTANPKTDSSLGKVGV